MARIHLKKLCVGVTTPDELAAWQNARIQAGSTLYHVTRSMPKRACEVLDGGSLYWIIKGILCLRQPILDLVPIQTSSGRKCKIVLCETLFRTIPEPHRAFQGWRYLEDGRAPGDLGPLHEVDIASLPDELAGMFTDLGLR
ncbi:MAG: DUF1489 domain-containing protein [Pseudomonadota bacterium]